MGMLRLRWPVVGAIGGVRWSAAAAGAVAMLLVGLGLGGATAASGAPSAPVPVRVLRAVPVPVKAVALTFDDGPSTAYTPEILSLLQQNAAKATFFVVGRELVRHPQLVRQEAEAGMEVGNHGFNHLSLRGMDPAAIQAEVKPVEQEITAITGNRPTLYRLPRGRSDPRALRALADLGYTVVAWNVDTQDYLPRTPQAIAQHVETQVRPGSIVIFHDGGGNRSATVAALRLLLPVLKQRGYQMVTVSQLLELATPTG